MKKIIVSDITLKKLAKERDVALLFREKTSVAACADSIGADIIELAPVKNLREDMIIYKTIAGKVKNAVLAIKKVVAFVKVSICYNPLGSRIIDKGLSVPILSVFPNEFFESIFLGEAVAQFESI